MGLSDDRKKANTRTYQALVAEVLGLDPAMVREPILEPSKSELASAQQFRAQMGFAGPLVGLNTGAGGRWAYKQWTRDHQVAFVQQMTNAGCGVVLLGGPEEIERHRDLMAVSAGKPVFDAGNQNSYGRFAALLQLCEAVVTSDSLAVHVAAARKIPAVVLFGPTSAAERSNSTGAA
jgi:heptosyltransferase-2